MRGHFLSILALLLFTPSSLASSYPPFTISSLTTHEPNGNPDGQVNFYHINFTVSSESSNSDSGSASSATAICTQTWPDNGWTQPAAYSVYVPSGTWLACAPSSAGYSFQLYPYFSIGNFTLGLRRNATDTVNQESSEYLQSSVLITNSTSTSNTTTDDDLSPDSGSTSGDTSTDESSGRDKLTCTINPHTAQYIQHASGDCLLPSSLAPLLIPVSSTSPAPVCPTSTPDNKLNTTFFVTAQTTPGQSILVSGSVPELGNWDTDKAIRLVSSDNDGNVVAVTWNGTVALTAGEQVQYKYLLDAGDGSALQWECCENRVWTVPQVGSEQACEEGGKGLVAGNDPDTFRG